MQRFAVKNHLDSQIIAFILLFHILLLLNSYVFPFLCLTSTCVSSQILSGKDHNIRFFGYSLAGNMDLDGNLYPDVAVGSLSDTAMIYRYIFFC